MNKYKPLAIDLFCGLGGWTEGLLAEGYDVVGFDIERHEYWVPEVSDREDGGKGTRPVAKRGITQGCAVSLGMEGANQRPRTRLLRYPAQLVVQDVLTLHGRQFRDATLIVASPPCQAYSYRAMPWKRAKALPPPDNTLFESCFRIQREACEAAERHIPLVVENVRGAQKWVGRARWNYGSFYLWGDVPALMVARPYSHQSKYGKICLSPEEWQRAQNGEAVVHPHNGRKAPAGTQWFNDGPRTPDSLASMGGKSKARKAASAMIAKIPAPLSRWIAQCYRP
jgi:site-specific DNA-cytosine methylase